MCIRDRVWINSTNLFDASAGFGGYRESGFGREGGREGMFEYIKRIPGAADTPSKKRDTAKRKRISGALSESAELRAQSGTPQIDRTPKLFIGGKQARPDAAVSYTHLRAHETP